MKPPLHHSDVDRRRWEFSDNQPPRMSLDSRTLEIWDLFVRNYGLVFQRFGESPEPRPEHDGHINVSRDSFTNVPRGSLRAVENRASHPLLLHIRDSQSLRRRRAADPPRKHDHRQNVWDHLNELIGNIYSALHSNRDRLGEAEKEAGEERADRIPFAEDQRGQRDEAAPGGHVAGEERILADGQISAA